MQIFLSKSDHKKSFLVKIFSKKFQNGAKKCDSLSFNFLITKNKSKSKRKNILQKKTLTKVERKSEFLFISIHFLCLD